MTISLTDVGSGYKRSAINSNFTTIESEINNNLLNKNGGVGLEADLDANSQKVINLADGVNNKDAVNLQQLNGAIAAAGSGLIASQIETQKGSSASGQVFTFTGITYTVGGNNLLVFQNGVKLAKGRDYTETSSSSITIDSAITINSGDDFDFITNVATTNSTTDTSAITHTESGTDYNLATYLQNRHVVNVKDFGAVGDGVTDDTAAIQAAIDAVYDSTNDREHGAVFLPTPSVGYNITGVTCYGRVKIEGENKWGTKVLVQGAGSYGFLAPRNISNIFFDGVAIANGTNRIDESAWTAADRGNTGVIQSNTLTGVSALGYSTVENCVFKNLAVAVERRGALNCVVRDCFIGGSGTENWHGVYNRAEENGTFGFNNACREENNYIQFNKGIGIGWYPTNQPYIDYQLTNNVVEFCCTDAAHDGIDGYLDVKDGTTNVKLYIHGLYMEADESTYPNAIGIFANVFSLDGFWLQGFNESLKPITTSSFWRVRNGDFLDTSGTYDVSPGTAGGRNVFENVAFENGLNPATLDYTTVIDCSNSGVLPSANAVLYKNHQFEIASSSGTNAPTIEINKRADGIGQRWSRSGIMAQQANISVSTSATALDSGTADGTTANKLVDSTQNFVTTVSTSRLVHNTTNDTWTTVTAVDSNTQLSLADDIMTSGDAYVIYQPTKYALQRPLGLPEFTVAQLAGYAAGFYTGCMIAVTDETGGYTTAFSDGTNWRRVQDRAVVS